MPHSLATKQVNVLLIDGSAVIRQRVAGMLREIDGVEVVGETGDGREGLELIRKLQPDVVILDIRMPGQSGLDVLERLKTDGLSPRVIALTNYPHAAYRRRCAELGTDFFFDKSTEFEKALHVLRDLTASTGCTHPRRSDGATFGA